MAKKRNRKRGWSGAPSGRPATGTPRPAGTSGSPTTGTATPAGGATVPTGPVTTEGNGQTATGAGTAAQTTKPAAAAKPAKGAAAASESQQQMSNRAARKEEARKQREAIRRKEARRRQMRRWGLIGGIVIAVGAVVALLVLTNGGSGDVNNDVDPNTLAGINTGPAPWPVETDNLSKRLDQVGLPQPGVEQTEVHFHQNLLIYVNGQREAVPTGLGTLPDGNLAEIHTHDSTGTIHVEAAATRDFVLGLVFDVWGVRFSWGNKPEDRCIGGYCEDETNKIRVFVDGKETSGDPTQVKLTDQQVVVVTYGTEDQLPDPMPSQFIYAGDPANPVPTSGATSAPATSAPATSAPATSAPATSAPATSGATSGPTG